jgi:hypothetical protein
MFPSPLFAVVAVVIIVVLIAILAVLAHFNAVQDGPEDVRADGPELLKAVPHDLPVRLPRPHDEDDAIDNLGKDDGISDGRRRRGVNARPVK